MSDSGGIFITGASSGIGEACALGLDKRGFHVFAGVRRIINVGSESGTLASPMMGPYCASKYAMEAISDVMRRELKPWKIRVSLLEPGVIATKIWGKARNRAEQAIKDSPEGLMRLYQPLFEKIMKHVAQSEKSAQSPDVVGEAVVHALTSPRPKTRYRMGPKASAQKMISWLPDTIQDRLIASFFNWGK